VVVTDSTRLADDFFINGEFLGERKVDIVIQGAMSALGIVSDSVKFRPDTPNPSSGRLWSGLYFDWMADPSVIDYADIGYAVNPIFLSWQYDPAVIKHSRIHHFGEVGIWASNCNPGVLIQNNTVQRVFSTGENFQPTDGIEGILIETTPTAVVKDNAVTMIDGTASIGDGIRILGLKGFCDQPTSPESLFVSSNTVTGPGATYPGGGSWSGIVGEWACGSVNRAILIGENLVTAWNRAGLHFMESSDVQVTCNADSGNWAGVLFEGGAQNGSAGKVQFRNNDLEVVDDFTPTNQEVLTTDDVRHLAMGPNTSVLGYNSVITAGLDWFMQENDPTSSYTLDARYNFWKRQDGIRTSVASIDSFITPLPPAPQGTRPNVANALSADPGLACTPGSAFRGPRVSAVDGIDRARPGSLGLGDLEPLETVLRRPGPNPARGTLGIAFSVAAPAERVRIEIFDVAGRRVSTPLERVMSPGRYRISWSGEVSSGGRAASGIYFVRMRAGDYEAVRKVVFLQ
jgi:hypothetical protein